MRNIARSLKDMLYRYNLFLFTSEILEWIRFYKTLGWEIILRAWFSDFRKSTDGTLNRTL